MKKPENTQTEENKEPVEETFPFSIIPVTLTFKGFPRWLFKFKRQLNKQARDAKEAFYGKTEEEQKAEIITHRIDLLGMLLTERPENVPDYPDTGDIKADFVNWASHDDNMDFMGWIWGQYQEKLYPNEL